MEAEAPSSGPGRTGPRLLQGLPSAPFAPVTGADLDRMTGKLFLADRAGRSAFWMLLTLAAVIASAGVVADSTATVIGAMIVAPLMTPILGTALALVLADRRQLLESVAVVVGGAVLVVVIGWLSGLLSPVPELAATNSQVASRVSPELVDLVSALATGAVGAFALVRSDVSDTLPGVAIAISLVPPLAVVGLTLESGAPDQAAGAMLLFLTNVTAIIATGTVVLLLYRVRATAVAAGRRVGHLRPRTIVVVGALLVAVTVPLGVGTYQTVRGQQVLTAAQPAVQQWARTRSWQVVDVTWSQGVLQVLAAGTPPAPDASSLRRALDDAGLADVPARLSEVLGGSRELPVTAPPPRRAGSLRGQEVDGRSSGRSHPGRAMPPGGRGGSVRWANGPPPRGGTSMAGPQTMTDPGPDTGPIDYLVVEFPPGSVTGEGMPLLLDLVDRGLIRILDLVFLRKEDDGGVTTIEIADLDGDGSLDLAAFHGAASGLLDGGDLAEAGTVLAPGTTAAVLVYENVWAAPLAAALRRGGAQLVAGGRIPVDVVSASLGAAPAGVGADTEG